MNECSVQVRGAHAHAHNPPRARGSGKQSSCADPVLPGTVCVTITVSTSQVACASAQQVAGGAKMASINRVKRKNVSTQSTGECRRWRVAVTKIPGKRLGIRLDPDTTVVQGIEPNQLIDDFNVDYEYLPAPGALALLGLGGIATRRRRS